MLFTTYTQNHLPRQRKGLSPKMTELLSIICNRMLAVYFFWVVNLFEVWFTR